MIRRKKKKSTKKISLANPLRRDPTRTQTLRVAFARKLRKKFAIIKGRILRLIVDEDAFGLAHRKVSFNSDSTLNCGGPGSGIPGPCPGVVSRLSEKAVAKIKGSYAKFSERYGKRGAIAIMAAMAVTMPLPGNIFAVLGIAEGVRAVAGLIKNEKTELTPLEIDRVIEDVSAIAQEEGWVFDAKKFRAELRRQLFRPTNAAEELISEKEKEEDDQADNIEVLKERLVGLLGVDDDELEELVANWCNQYGGDTCKGGSPAAVKGKSVKSKGKSAKDVKDGHGNPQFPKGSTAEKVAKNLPTPKGLIKSLKEKWKGRMQTQEGEYLAVAFRERLAGACEDAAKEMMKDLKAQGIETKLMKGWYLTHDGYIEGHVALVAKDGTVIDPTESQFRRDVSPGQVRIYPRGNPQFSRSRAEMVRLRKAQGTAPTNNAFCPTGAGQKMFTANKRWSFLTSQEKLDEFQKWIREQFQSELLGKSDRQLWEAFAKRGFEKGAGRAFEDVNGKRRWMPGEGKFYAGSKDQFLRSAFGRAETVEKIQLLASRDFTDLKNVTEAMATQMGRTLADGLSRGDNPRDIAAEMSEDLDIGYQRAETIARTEIIRAHAEGQLDMMEKLGVTEVGVMVEWFTAGDERVCKLCEPLEGIVLKVDESHNMIPRHPNCRCAFIPANVTEVPSSSQKTTKEEIDAAIQESIQLEGGETDWAGADAEIDEVRPALNVEVTSALLEFDSLIHGDRQ